MVRGGIHVDFDDGVGCAIGGCGGVPEAIDLENGALLRVVEGAEEREGGAAGESEVDGRAVGEGDDVAGEEEDDDVAELRARREWVEELGGGERLDGGSDDDGAGGHDEAEGCWREGGRGG